ncbi:endonuclease V [Halobacteriales archaeon QH_2_66_30]|nr:MAG: endonuclease V [Halobacteriales archaeon QH_2_66_30]
MDAVRPEFVPDPSLSRDEMEQLQRDIAAAAVFEDDVGEVLTTALEDSFGVDSRPLVAGVDQGFHGDDATSAIVVMQNSTVVERVHATERAEIPYIPGLLSFREGGAILSAFERLECDPDVVLVDGSGRIHFREAGLATHIGVTLDVPTVGVAKSLLCGRPRQPIEQGLPEGTRVAIEADGDVTASAGTVIGYAVQTRQYDSPDRHVNPLYVSPGHRVGAETAADIVARYATEYKLPEPVRLADRHADEVIGRR